MQNKILDSILEVREIETSKALEMSVARSLQIVKSYIGYDVPKDLMTIATDLALLIFDKKGYVYQIDGVKSIKEGEVSVTFLEDAFQTEMADIHKELNLFRCAIW